MFLIRHGWHRCCDIYISSIFFVLVVHTNPCFCLWRVAVGLVLARALCGGDSEWVSGSWRTTLDWPGLHTCHLNRHCALSCCWMTLTTLMKHCSRSEIWNHWQQFDKNSSSQLCGGNGTRQNVCDTFFLQIHPTWKHSYLDFLVGCPTSHDSTWNWDTRKIIFWTSNVIILFSGVVTVVVTREPFVPTKAKVFSNS